MRFGIVLPMFPDTVERVAEAQKGMKSLLKTNVAVEKPHLLFVVQGLGGELAAKLVATDSPFITSIVQEPYYIEDTEQPLAWGTDFLIKNTDATHIVWLGHDLLVHPDWLVALSSLIWCHPVAMAWSVYRSSHTTVHEEIRTDGEAVLVKSICGHGLTMSREEWVLWNVNWNEHKGKCRWGQLDKLPQLTEGTTLDLYHARMREGERWCTRRSFIEHTGRYGVNCSPEIPEFANDFVGEQA